MGHLNSFKTSEGGISAPLSQIWRLVLFLYSSLLFLFLTSGMEEQRKVILLSELESWVINS